MIRAFIVIFSVLCLTFTGFAQDNEVSTDQTSHTSLEFVNVPVINQIDRTEQVRISELNTDLELLTPSAGMLEETPASGFAKEDTWRWTTQIGLGMEHDNSNNHFALGGIGFSYFPVDDFSFNVELDGIYFEQDGVDDAGGLNFNLLLRWHYYTQEKWTAFAEVAGGLVINTKEVPPRGGGFNFIAQAGAGISYALDNDVRLLTGLRWHHLSNGRTFDNNPGMDSVYVFAGLSMPF